LNRHLPESPLGLPNEHPLFLQVPSVQDMPHHDDVSLRDRGEELLAPNPADPC
jgi:hypothetical protein